MNNAIFVAFDDHHWHYFTRLYNSLQENYPNHPILLVHYDGFDLIRRKWLQNRSDIRLFYHPKLSINLNYMHYHKAVQSRMVYFKYLLWTDQYDEYDNILHLDVDTIVLSTLDELFEQNNFFVVFNNISFKEVTILPRDRKGKALAGYWLGYHGIKKPEHDDMVNAGIFVIPKKYRKEKYLNSLIEITNDFKNLLVYADQSALSLWCLKHEILPSKEYQYNFQLPLFDKFFRSRYKGKLNLGNYFSLKEDILNKIKIIHYSGPIKPDCTKFREWNLMGRYKKIFLDCYDKYSGIRL